MRLSLQSWLSDDLRWCDLARVLSTPAAAAAAVHHPLTALPARIVLIRATHVVSWYIWSPCLRLHHYDHTATVLYLGMHWVSCSWKGSSRYYNFLLVLKLISSSIALDESYHIKVYSGTIMYSVSQKKSPTPWNFLTLFPKRLGIFLVQTLHAYYAFLSTLDYNFLFNYLQFYYAILSATTIMSH